MGDIRGGQEQASAAICVFETMSEATRAGKAALAELRANGTYFM
jgi:hypothetical protein